MRAKHTIAGATSLSLLLAFSSAVFAAPSAGSKGPAIGITSGPADGTNVYTGTKLPSADRTAKKMNTAVTQSMNEKGSTGSQSGSSVKPTADE
jgi:hypothetical protein